MNYPLISDYVSSILSAEDNFKELTHLRPVLDEEGQPIMSSGNFAVVFKMKDEQTGKLYAVKCFLKEQEGRAESYKLIEEELEFVSSNYLTPIRYMEDELCGFCFKDSYRQKACNTASFSGFLPFPAVLRKYILYNYHLHLHKCSLHRQEVLMASSVIMMAPSIVIYAFLQKYFEKGVMLGSVKG